MGINADTARFLAMSTTTRFVVVDRSGALKDRNDFGKAIPYAFVQRPAAVKAAKSANLRRDHSVSNDFVVYDVSARQTLEAR